MTQETALLSTSPEAGDLNVPARKVFVKTYGCQMNVYDSDRMSDALSRDGYVATDVLKTPISSCSTPVISAKRLRRRSIPSSVACAN